MSPDMMMFAMGGLAFLVLAGIGLAFSGNSNEAAKRARQLQATGKASSGKNARTPVDENAKRRKQTQEMLNGLRTRDQERKKSLVPQDIKSKLEQAGLSFSVPVFYLGSLVLGIMLGGVIVVTGAVKAGLMLPFTGGFMLPGPVIMGMAFIVGFIGIPRWTVGMLVKRRHKKMTNQFADAVDIIVRGVKSGLPLAECLRIIGRESPDPLGSEFQGLTDSIQMGTELERALQKFYKRIPLPEVNFFIIVLTIQAKAGGNLSEALGNLSIVIRSRKMMREKIKALSSEAKASAMIIGCLPFAVGFMVFLTTPDYIMELFLKPTGHMILAIGTFLMTLGITTMRKMINFDI